MQRDRQGVPLGLVVVGGAGAGAEERVQVAGSAGGRVAHGVVGQREVDEHQLPGPVGPAAQDDVVGLEVAVRDALAVEVVDGDEQVACEDLQFVDRQPALAQLAGHGLLARVVEDEHRAPADDEGVLPGQPDHPRVAEAAQHVCLVLEPRGPLVGERDLQDLVAVRLLVVREERAARRAGTQPAPDPPLPADEVTALGLQRVQFRCGLLGQVDRRGGRALRCRDGRRRELPDDELQPVEELADGGEALLRLRSGGQRDQVVRRLGQRVDDRGRVQPAGLGEPRLQHVAGQRGGLTGQDQVGERAQAEDVDADRVRVRGVDLGGEVALCGPFQLRQVPVRGLDGERDRGLRHRAGQLPRRRVDVAGRCLPVADDQPGGEPAPLALCLVVAAAGGRHDEDAAGRERPVVEVAAVRVVERLGNLADHAQPGAGVEPVAVPGEVVVEAHLVGVVAEDQGRAGLMLLQAVDLDDALVIDPVEDEELTLGCRLPGAALGLARSRLHQVDPHAAARGGHLVCRAW